MLMVLTPTQQLTLEVARKIRMRCNPGHYLALDAMIEYMDSEDAKKLGKSKLAELYLQMKSEDGNGTAKVN